ncbi:MAG: glycosyltransferase family 2 protein [Gammaproteobacteria bacterium]
MIAQVLPTISVVIPLYNKPQYVRRAVESALAQGDAILEVVVVDDGSTDDSAARVKALNHVKVRLVEKPNGGVSSARNRGIEEARGEFIAFLDADDLYLPGFIDEIIGLIRMFPEATVYATSYTFVWSDSKRKNALLPRSIKKTKPQIVEQLFSAFSRSTIFSISSSACVRRQAMVRHNIYFPEGENVGEDQDVIFRLAEKGTIAFSPRFLAEYTQGISNSLYSVLPLDLPPCYLRLAERMKSKGFPDNQRKGAARLLSVSYLNVTRTNIEHGKRKRAARVLFHPRAFFHWTYWIRTLVRFCLPVNLFRTRWLRRI